MEKLSDGILDVLRFPHFQQYYFDDLRLLKDNNFCVTKDSFIPTFNFFPGSYGTLGCIQL